MEISGPTFLSFQFKSQAQHRRFINLVSNCIRNLSLYYEKDGNKQKEASDLSLTEYASQYKQIMTQFERKNCFSELERSAKLLEDLTSSRGKDKDGVDPVQRSLFNLRGQLQASEAKVKALEEACAEAEEVFLD